MMTGAPVPRGATGVIRVEHTDGGDGQRVLILDASDADRHIRRTGEDIERNDLLLPAGAEITPAGVTKQPDTSSILAGERSRSSAAPGIRKMRPATKAICVR